MIATSTTTTEDLVDLIACEMASGVEKAVDCWMSQVERAMTDSQLTTLGRINAVKEVLEHYKRVTGKVGLAGRS